MQPQTKHAQTAKPLGAPQGRHLDSGLRIAAMRLIRERNIAPELVSVCFGISSTQARALARKARANER